MRWRTLLVVLVTIPTSLVAAAIALDLLGETFNAITFAGLALALAIIVDDAVTGAENIARRLAQRRAEGSEPDVAATVLDATREIRSPLGYARAHRAARDRAAGDHGGPARRVPRPARGRLRRRGRDGDDHGADADAGARRPAHAG